MNKIKSAITLAALTAAAGGAVLAGAGSAAAQGTATPWAPGGVSADSNAVGGLAFFDASGNQITSGSTSGAPFTAYAVGLGVPRAGDTKASLFLFEPVYSANPDPSSWTGNIIGTATTYPNTAAPSPVKDTALPVNTGDVGDASLDTMISSLPPTATQAGYQNVYEIRMFTGAKGKPTTAGYDYADISIDSTNHTWHLVWSPDQAGTATTGTLTTDKDAAGHVNTGTSITLTDTLSPATAGGTVQFKDNGVAIGGPVTVSGGVATVATTVASDGANAFSAVYSPAALSGYSGNTSNTDTITGDHSITTTSVSLAVNPTSGPAYSAVTLSGTVTPNIAGQVKFYDSGAQIGVASVDTSTGTATLSYNQFAPGDHANITAQFFPTNQADYSNSAMSAAVDFNASAPACTTCRSDSTVQTTVNPGTLSIATPYTPTHPLVLPDMALNGAGTELSTHAAFGSAAVGDTPSGANSIYVVDTRAGNADWAASAQASVLTSQNKDLIDAQNVGLTGLQAIPVTGNALTASSLQFTPNPAAEPAVAPNSTGQLGLGGGVAHQFAATTGGGDGSIGMVGTLTITAPTSTKAGTYTGVVTFTVA